MLVRRQQQVQAPRDREPFFCHANGRLEERGPWQLAVLLMRQVEHLEHPWHADREPSDDRDTQCQGLALRVEEARWRRRRWRCLTAIECHHLCPVMEQEQGPATNARGLWLGQAQHHLRCNRCIDSRTALLQDIVAGLGCEGIGRGDHRPSRPHHGFLRKASGAFRRYIGMVWGWWNVHSVTLMFYPFRSGPALSMLIRRSTRRSRSMARR